MLKLDRRPPASPLEFHDPGRESCIGPVWSRVFVVFITGTTRTWWSTIVLTTVSSINHPGTRALRPCSRWTMETPLSLSSYTFGSRKVCSTRTLIVSPLSPRHLYFNQQREKLHQAIENKFKKDFERAVQKESDAQKELTALTKQLNEYAVTK